jgi:hypothetical protein
MARLSWCLRLNKTRGFRFTIQAHQGCIHRSRTWHDGFLHIGAELAEMILWWPYTNRNRLILLHTYFMVAGALTKNCFHRILRYLSSYAFFSMPSCSPDVSLHHTYTTPRVYTLTCPNQPNTRLLFSDWRPLHCWNPEDTSDWSSADPYSRASTSLKKLITSLYFLKGTLQRTFGQKLSYIISREEYPIDWLIGVFIGTQTFSVPTSSC